MVITQDNVPIFLACGGAVLLLMVFLLARRKTGRAGEVGAIGAVRRANDIKSPDVKSPDVDKIDARRDDGNKVLTIEDELLDINDIGEPPARAGHTGNSGHTASADDDIIIPRMGEVPDVPNVPMGASAEKAKDAMPTNAPTSAPNLQSPMGDSEEARLAEIERKILALRELYEAGLIAAEIYVIKAREFAEQSKGK